MAENIINEKQESKEISFKLLLALRKEYVKELDQIADLDISFEEKQQKRKNWTEGYLHSLLEQKERFGHIFKTENGSVYFVLKTGECWRFKKEKKDGSYKEQPIVLNTFFLDKDFGDDFEKRLKDDRLFMDIIIGEKIKISKIELGARPLELGIFGFDEAALEKGEDYIKILGTKTKLEDDQEEIVSQLFFGFHLGHRIKKIIK
jgi:hypothetical protein